jgi:hypothetical protein
MTPQTAAAPMKIRPCSKIMADSALTTLNNFFLK